MIAAVTAGTLLFILAPTGWWDPKAPGHTWRLLTGNAYVYAATMTLALAVTLPVQFYYCGHLSSVVQRVIVRVRGNLSCVHPDNSKDGGRNRVRFRFADGVVSTRSHM